MLERTKPQYDTHASRGYVKREPGRNRPSLRMSDIATSPASPLSESLFKRTATWTFGEIVRTLILTAMFGFALGLMIGRYVWGVL